MGRRKSTNTRHCLPVSSPLIPTSAPAPLAPAQPFTFAAGSAAAAASAPYSAPAPRGTPSLSPTTGRNVRIRPLTTPFGRTPPITKHSVGKRAKKAPLLAPSAAQASVEGSASGLNWLNRVSSSDCASAEGAGSGASGVGRRGAALELSIQKVLESRPKQAREAEERSWRVEGNMKSAERLRRELRGEAMDAEDEGVGRQLSAGDRANSTRTSDTSCQPSPTAGYASTSSQPFLASAEASASCSHTLPLACSSTSSDASSTLQTPRARPPSPFSSIRLRR